MKYAIIAAAFAATITTAASAQEARIEPYVGLLGGYELFDRSSDFGTVPGQGAVNGGLIEGLAGVNVPLGPLFVGAEGTVAKGTKGDIHWEYGAKGRIGARAGNGLIYISAGYQWVEGTHGFADHHDVSYGMGVELNPADMGLAHIFGTKTRFRLSTETYNFDSIRPMMGTTISF